MSIKSLSPRWNELLNDEFNKPYFTDLTQKVNEAYSNKSITVYPPARLVFNAFNLCPFEEIKVVIIGQDPYHGPNQAQGLCFSVDERVPKPPSLQNIFKELQNDIPGFIIPATGNLEAWAKRGVLLLNAVLTVEAGKPGSHKVFGWEQFTDAVIKLVNDKKKNVVFLLWGAFAHSKAALIDTAKHKVLMAAHPSPLARGAFFGCAHFSQTNAYLAENNLEPINWKLD